MIPLNYIFGKCIGDNKFTKLEDKMNYLMNMDDIKTFAKIEKNSRHFFKQYDIQLGYKNEIWNWKVCHH